MKKRRTERMPLYESPLFLEMQQRLAQNLRNERDRRGWTQEDAAQACDMSPRLIQRLEAGASNVTLTTLARICTGYDLDPADLWHPAPKVSADR